MSQQPGDNSILIEAEDFANYGGWLLDSQFETQMGSPYLMAHGLGRPVEDATTSISLDQSGTYHVWVRTRDWAAPYGPGHFELSINGERLKEEFGKTGEAWHWQSAGTIELAAGEVSLALHDMTGFNGRCDAIYLSTSAVAPPNEVNDESRKWRRQLRKLPDEPVCAGAFDAVVVGGGMSGCAAALVAARQGLKTALIHDRPVLGGNASVEIGLMPRGAQGEILKELSQRTETGDLVALSVLEAEPNVSVFLEHRVFNAQTDGAKIISIDTVQARGGHEHRFDGKMFIDTSGVAILGVLAGAETMFGREARSEFNEQYAPDAADEMHHGNTLFFRTRMADGPVPFPEVPWATVVSKDYANLSGQLIEPGLENGPGPRAGENPQTPEFRFGQRNDVFPATHFWEYGQWLDPYTSGELVRDHLMRALFGTFSNVKRMEPEAYANLEFDWMAFVAAQGEYRRYRGDYVLTENDIRDHQQFDDTMIANDGSFCLHCAFDPGESDYDFRLKDWIFDMRDQESYEIPFRCLYSKNIDNLMMAGKHISVSHVAASATKLMGNGAQHGVAVGIAAAMCVAKGTTPRGLYEDHLEGLKTLVHDQTSCDHDIASHPPKPKFERVPG